MRILDVRFKNLNSLAGEWSIDLTNAAYASDGIFAITGPTGSGKTTILDAICLALYGRTPRLDKVTKGANEIMSRRTGECFAEVTFATGDRRFRCCWSQNRARNRPDGELQAPKHELSDAVTGKILESRLRGVAERIEQATGMDFERFTRSMLLAQGGFAAFLKASPGERAPILEQITGTEVYSDISKRVHERRAQEQKKLDVLGAELSAMRLLGEDEERTLRAALAEKERETAAAGALLETKSRALAWLEGVQRLEGELESLARKRDDLSARREAFRPDLLRLERAMRALELEGAYEALSSLRRDQEADERAAEECRVTLPGLEDDVTHAQRNSERSDEAFLSAKAEQQERVPVFRKVRDLDVRIAERDAPIRKAADALSAMEAESGELLARNETDRAALGDVRSSLDAVVAYMAENAADEALSERLGAVRSRFYAFREARARLGTKTQERLEAEKQYATALSSSEERKAALSASRRAIEELDRAVVDAGGELDAALAGRTLPQMRQAFSDAGKRAAVAERIADDARTHTDARRKAADVSPLLESLGVERERLAREIPEAVEALSVCESERERLESEQMRLRAAESYAEARARLADGEPCPLCGAVTHPYASVADDVPSGASDEIGAMLRAVGKDRKKAETRLADLRVRDAEVLGDIRRSGERLKELEGEIAESRARIGERLASLPPEVRAPEDGILSNGGACLLQKAREALRASEEALRSAEEKETAFARARDARDTALDAWNRLERDAQKAVHEADMAHRALDRADEDVRAAAEESDRLLAEAANDVASWGAGELTADSMDAIDALLDARRIAWRDRERRRRELEDRAARLEADIRNRDERLERLCADIERTRGERDSLAGIRDLLMRERRELFGERSPDHEEERLRIALEDAERGHRDALDALRRAERERDDLLRRGESLGKAIRERSGALHAAAEAFSFRLHANGFSDEADFRAACMPREERNALSECSDALAQEQAGLDAQHREKTDALENERRKRMTEQSKEALDTDVRGMGEHLRRLQQELGGIRQKLDDNDEALELQRERLRARDAQKAECSRWDALHGLIGSADGWKYRNFVQALTFERMIDLANRQLRQMSDRYLLVRDAEQPLELNVRDAWQAGEIRSVKNLSGGESFIVSLTLALGLSRMASRKVRVDSLFLDEGFGTLDEDALETALQTLAGLSGNGKLIGVISHVPAIRERIAAQIEVRPLAGGCSELVGPGCAKAG